MALKEEKVFVISGKKNANVRRKTSAFSGMRVTIVPNKNRHRKPLHPLSHQWHWGRSESRKRNVRGRSQTGRILRQPCRYYLKGTFTSSPESGCNAGDKCLFPHYKGEEQPSKKPQKELSHSKRKERRQRCCIDCENCNTVGLRLARLRAITTSKKAWGTGGHPMQKSFGTDSKKYDSLSLRYVKKVSGKVKEHRLENTTSQNSSSAKSLRCEIWGPVSRRDWKTTAMCPKQGLEPGQTFLYIRFAFWRVGYASRINQKVGGKRVCGRFQS